MQNRPNKRSHAHAMTQSVDLATLSSNPGKDPLLQQELTRQFLKSKKPLLKFLEQSQDLQRIKSQMKIRKEELKPNEPSLRTEKPGGDQTQTAHLKAQHLEAIASKADLVKDFANQKEESQPQQLGEVSKHDSKSITLQDRPSHFNHTISKKTKGKSKLTTTSLARTIETNGGTTKFTSQTAMIRAKLDSLKPIKIDPFTNKANEFRLQLQQRQPEKVYSVKDFMPSQIPGDANWNKMRKKNDLFKALFEPRFAPLCTKSVSPSGLDFLKQIKKRSKLTADFQKLVMLRRQAPVYNQDSF